MILTRVTSMIIQATMDSKQSLMNANVVYNLLNSFKNTARNLIIAGNGFEAIFFFLAKWHEKRNNYHKAIRYYRAGLTRIDSKDTPKIFRIRQYWQFYLERAYYLAGRARVSDPIFRCAALPVNPKNNPALRKPAGGFEAGWTHHGLRLDGFVMHKKASRVEVRLNNRLILTIPVRSRNLLPLGYFHFPITREVLNLFPTESTLEVRVSSGDPLVWKGGKAAQIRIPHGSGKLIMQLDKGASINKKGFFALSPDEVRHRQDRYLKIYKQANEFFVQRLQKPLFLMYGTLLGYYREGDLISTDDDFDAGYVSHQPNGRAVKEETKRLVVDLVLAGFNISFNRKGRLFRLRLKDDHPQHHLDIRPVWYEDGHVWAHLQACLPLSLNDFLPVEEGRLRGVSVNIPRDSVAFLKAYYGPGWKVPDPGYSNATRRPPSFVRKKLALVYISPAEYREMLEEIHARRIRHPGAGELVSIGSHSLYPLKDYETACGW